MSKLPLPVLALALVASGSGASGGARAAEPMKMEHGPMAPGAPAEGGGTAADRAFAAANEAMMTGMDVKPSGDPDRDFVAMMLPHHAGAVAMARVELQYGKDPMLRNMAAGIIKAQDAEMAEMRDWQKRHPR